MKFALAGQQFRHFRAGLQCLGKIGSELLIEALPERLVLRSINSSRSAFAAVTYYEDFFDAYDMGASAIVQGGLHMKQMAAIFRSQRAQRTFFELEENATHLVATVVCENGLQKVYKVPVNDTEILQATLDKDSLSISLVGHADEFNRLLSSFQSSLSEITIIALPRSGPGGSSTKDVKIKSYVDPSKGFSEKALYTNLDVSAAEVFTDYDNRDDVLRDVTFNLKDFRAMLQLCDGLRADICLRFDSAGDPLVVGPHLAHGDAPEMRYDAELVLATLLESQTTGMDTAGRAVGRALPGSGRIRTPNDTPGQAGDGRTLADGAGPAAAGQQVAGLPPSSGAGRSRFAPPDMACRDLRTAMQQAGPPGSGGGRLASGSARSPVFDGQPNGHQDARNLGSRGAAGPSNLSAGGHAAAMHSAGQQQQQQPQQQQPGRPPDAHAGNAAFTFLGADGGAAPAYDEGLDNFASLPPDGDNFHSQRRAESESVSARNDNTTNAASGHGATGDAAQHGQFGVEYDDDDMDDADAVPGTPPG